MVSTAAIGPRFGAIGKSGSIALLELFWSTLKSAGLRKLLVPYLVIMEGKSKPLATRQASRPQELCGADTSELSARIRRFRDWARLELPPGFDSRRWILAFCRESSGIWFTGLGGDERSGGRPNAAACIVILLLAFGIYKGGHGFRGSLKCTPQRCVLDALVEAFYLAFDAIEPTGKRILLALDVSASMTGGVIGGAPGVTPRIASAAMAMVTARTIKRVACGRL